MIEKWEQDHTVANPYMYVPQVNRKSRTLLSWKLADPNNRCHSTSSATGTA